MQTKLAEELERKYPEMSAGSRLTVLAVDCLRKANRNPIAAHDEFVNRVMVDAQLLATLVKPVYIRGVALSYLQRQRADMVRGGTKPMDGERGQASLEAQIETAPSPSASLPGEGQLLRDDHSRAAQPRQTLEGAGGQFSRDNQSALASPPSPQDSSGGQVLHDAHRPIAPAAVPITDTTRRAYGDAAKIIAVTIMDTHRLSNGVAIGEVYWGSLHRMRSASARDAALLRMLINCGHADGHLKVRDVVSIEQLQVMIQKAAEIADAM